MQGACACWVQWVAHGRVWRLSAIGCAGGAGPHRVHGGVHVGQRLLAPDRDAEGGVELRKVGAFLDAVDEKGNRLRGLLLQQRDHRGLQDLLHVGALEVREVILLELLVELGTRHAASPRARDTCTSSSRPAGRTRAGAGRGQWKPAVRRGSGWGAWAAKLMRLTRHNVRSNSGERRVRARVRQAVAKCCREVQAIVTLHLPSSSDKAVCAQAAGREREKRQGTKRRWAKAAAWGERPGFLPFCKSKADSDQQSGSLSDHDANAMESTQRVECELRTRALSAGVRERPPGETRFKNPCQNSAAPPSS